MNKLLLTALFLFSFSAYSQDRLVFSDDFEDNRWDWPVFSHDNAEGKFNYGRYQFEHKRESGSWSTYQAIKLNEKRPWRIEVVMGHLKGVNNHGYSLLFGKDGNSYYQFALSGNGYFFIGKTIDGDYSDILDWVEKKNLINTSGGLNKIEIIGGTGRWEFKINGERVHEMAALDFHGNSMGFNVSNAQSITVESMRIYQDDNPIQVVADVPADLVKENLGRNINTEWSEKMPIIAPDGKTLFFVRDSYPLNTSPEHDDIWFSTLDGDEWSVAKQMPYPLNQDFHNTVISVTPDNNSLMLMNRYLSDGSGSNGKGISLSQRTEDGWSIPQDVTIDNYYNNGIHSESNLSSNGKVILITLNREDTQNADDKDSRDIYVCFRNDDGSFSEPKNIGATVNTTGDETSPFLAADDKTMFFSSNGWPGYGSSDIFMTKRLDDTWMNWSEPKNLGMGINTSDWDAYFNIPASGAYAYMISTNNSVGSGDVFRIKLPPALLPEPVVLVSGVVYDSKTEQPIGAKVTYTDITTGVELGIASSDPTDGTYQIVLPLGKQYAFRGEKEAYYPMSEYLDVRELSAYQEITEDLHLTPLEVGQTIRINNIFFEFNESELKQESFEELNLLVRILENNPNIKIELGGHTDSKGSDDYNLQLSTSRAASVRTYLSEKGIAADRLISKGYGEGKPVATNDTEEGQALNRRVEFTILE